MCSYAHRLNHPYVHRSGRRHKMSSSTILLSIYLKLDIFETENRLVAKDITVILLPPCPIIQTELYPVCVGVREREGVRKGEMKGRQKVGIKEEKGERR